MSLLRSTKHNNSRPVDRGAEQIPSARFLAPRFDSSYYRRAIPQLSTDDEAREHFERDGIGLGVPGSPACDQGYFVRMIHRMKVDKLLEIGPGQSPRLRGPNVRYFDVKSTEQLRERYLGDGADSGVPEHIHYADPNGDLSVISEKFDVVFSCHMIEHSLDLISHLNMVADRLNPGGYYFLVAPNKNYTFDYFKPHSFAEDAIAHHVMCDGAPRLSIRALLYEVTRRTHNDVQRHWSGDHGAWNHNPNEVTRAIKSYDRINSDPVARSGYHSWFFDDRSFSQLINDLHKLAFIDLKLLASYNTPRGSCSFNAVLQKGESL